MKMSEHDCELTTKVQYAHATEGVVEASFIKLKAPRIGHISHTSVLKQHFVRAIVSLQGNNNGSKPEDAAKDGEDKPLNADDVISILESSPESIAVVIDLFKKFMLNSELFLLDGEVPVTTVLYAKFDPEDMYKVMGTYFANFIIASLMK